MAQKIREAQGQSPTVEVDGRNYVYKKLKRRKCHQVLYNLVAPFIRIVSTFIQEIAVPISDIVQGKFNADKMAEGLTKEFSVNTSAIANLISGLPFEEYWALAQNILNGVEIDGVQYGNLDDHDFYDDKPLHLVKAILKGIEVNYPFLKDMIKKKADGSTASSPEKSVPVEKE
jgi:hypothetical protein